MTTTHRQTRGTTITTTATALAAGLVLAGCGLAPLAPPAAPVAPAPAAPVASALAAAPPEVVALPAAPPMTGDDAAEPAVETAVEPAPAPAVTAPQPEVGIASWYGRPFHGRRTANGERYDMRALTAAHPSLPLPSFVQVRHIGNGREVVLRVNDRGPFKAGRIIDLSHAAARLLGIGGIAKVEVVLLARDDERVAVLPVPPPRRARHAAVVREARRADAARPRDPKAEPVRRGANVSASAARRSARSG